MMGWRCVALAFLVFCSFTTRASALPPPPKKPSQDDALKFCYNQVGRMRWTATFLCRDFTKWFIKCSEMQGFGSTIEPIDVFCRGNCKESRGHRFVIYKKGSLWCPGEPQHAGGGEAATCCRADKEQAKACAARNFCDGEWWNISGAAHNSSSTSRRFLDNPVAEPSANTLHPQAPACRRWCRPRRCYSPVPPPRPPVVPPVGCVAEYEFPREDRPVPWQEESCTPEEQCAIEDLIGF